MFPQDASARAALLVGAVIGIVMQVHLDPELDADTLIQGAAALFQDRPVPPVKPEEDAREGKLLRRAMGVFRGR